MNKPHLLFLILTMATGTASLAQRVKRKGTDFIDVSKNKRQPVPAKPQFTTDQLVGKWQEVKRTDNGKIPLDFTDTLFLDFITKTRVVTRENNSKVSMNGAASIEAPGNILLAAADVYTILAATDSLLTLDDQEGSIHHFQKTNSFFFESYGKLAVKKELFEEPVAFTMNDVKGSWMVFKRVARPGAIRPPTNIIRNLKITDSTGEQTAKGEIVFYQTDKSQLLPCTIKITNTGLDIVAGEFKWLLNVYKAEKNELVFGDPEIMLYYAKYY